RRLPRSSLFPYTTLFRSRHLERRSHRIRNSGEERVPPLEGARRPLAPVGITGGGRRRESLADGAAGERRLVARPGEGVRQLQGRDRKSTRLNSSHQIISY